MQELLRDLAGHDRLIQEIRPILAAFPEAGSTVASGTVAISAVQLIPQSPTALVEPLTAREHDILVLLSCRMSNKEISQKLGISPLTVKRHVINLSKKLGVNRRQEAVARAIALGLLPESEPSVTQS